MYCACLGVGLRVYIMNEFLTQTFMISLPGTSDAVVLEFCLTRFEHKMGQIGRKWDESGTFSDQISVHFGAMRQNVLKSDLKKSPGFVPFGVNLPTF